MVRLEIEIDEDTDRMLRELASEYEGDLGLAVSDLVHVHRGLEEVADQVETTHEDRLRTMRDSSEADFRNGRTVSWEDVKKRNSL